jgi:hypothetical protein
MLCRGTSDLKMAGATELYLFSWVNETLFSLSMVIFFFFFICSYEHRCKANCFGWVHGQNRHRSPIKQAREREYTGTNHIRSLQIIFEALFHLFMLYVCCS